MLLTTFAISINLFFFDDTTSSGVIYTASQQVWIDIFEYSIHVSDLHHYGVLKVELIKQ